MPSYEAQKERFERYDTQVLGISVDSVPCLVAWAESLGGITYPFLSDFWPHGEIAQRYGVLRSEGKTERALFIIDKEGIIRYIDIHDIDDQPDNEELFAELDKFQAPKPLEKPEDELPSSGVVMYCSQWCPECKRARSWLAKHNVEFEEVNLYASEKAMDVVRGWNRGRLATPTFNINGKVVVGFKEAKLSKILNVS
jgi:glutaredoxin